MGNLNILVEFTGISRILTGETEIAIPLHDGAQLTDVIQSLSRRFPALVREVIENDGCSMISTNLFSVNGAKILHEDNLHFQPSDGDRLILLSLLAGG